jgi:hypothetical protein
MVVIKINKMKKKPRELEQDAPCEGSGNCMDG